jgi:hypothetical protein
MKQLDNALAIIEEGVKQLPDDDNSPEADCLRSTLTILRAGHLKMKAIELQFTEERIKMHEAQIAQLKERRDHLL